MVYLTLYTAMEGSPPPVAERMRVSTHRRAGLACKGYENDTMKETQVLAAVVIGISEIGEHGVTTFSGHIMRNVCDSMFVCFCYSFVFLFLCLVYFCFFVSLLVCFSVFCFPVFVFFILLTWIAFQ